MNEDRMKFYEFNNQDYYALIGAKTEDEALKYYKETVAEYDEDYPPNNITEEKALEKLLSVCNEKEKLEELDYFKSHICGDEPYIVAIDGSLF